MATAAELRKLQARSMSEDQLLTEVIHACRTLHLWVAHFRPAWTSKGWRTPVQGDGKGFPDCLIAGPGGVLYRELKGPRGHLSVEQRAWLDALDAAGQNTAVWDSTDWVEGRIVRELREVAS